jgi:EAL domain-containing protein (putative c-di-GMP-specific phosphodiesterase class I)/GGDEF domain-containing protein
MKAMWGSYKLFIAAVLFYIAGVLVYAWLEYQHESQSRLKALDEQLLETVSVAEHLLQQELRDNLTGKRPLTTDEDYLLSLKLQELAEQMQVTYIYSLIQRDNSILFISSNPEPEELTSNRYEMAFLMPYDEAPAELLQAFSSGNVTFGQYEDRWGHFRSVFFPFDVGKSTDSDAYVIGVDIQADEIEQIAIQSLLKAIVYGLFLGLIAFPLVCIYLRTVKRQYQEKLFALQKHPLTGLPNKRYLKGVLEKHENEQLLLIDIENFDYVISTLGVSAIDELIIKLAYKLKELDVEGIEHCQLFHLDDSQFALHSTYDFSDRQVRSIISTVYRCLTESKIATENDRQAPLVIRMGAVRHCSNALMLAGMALLHAKNTNQSLVLYEPSLNLPHYFQNYIDVFNKLSDALQHERVKVFFQPILDIHLGKIVKYEALARIMDENGQVISSPDEFMPIAYQSRLCHKLTRVMIKKVIESIGYSDHIVSINISVKDLFDQKTRDYIIQTIREGDVGTQIELELLEQQMITNYRLAAAYITQLKSCVSQIGMDDLGKLYSNFDRLLALPLDFVKIDGGVIQAIERDSDARSIVEGIVSFAQQKGLHVIAEHCSNESICNMVVLMGVNLLQGFHIGYPAEHFLNSNHIREAG